MKTFETNWEVITASSSNKGRKHSGKMVYLTAANANRKDLYTQLNLTAELAEEACIVAGDRYELLKDPDDPKRFCIQLHKAGTRTFRQTPGCKVLFTTGYLMVAEMRPDINGTEFDVDVIKPNGDIIIRARKE